jgi:hypothetical protein
VQQRRLAAGDADWAQLTAEEAVEAEEDRAELVRGRHGIINR